MDVLTSANLFTALLVIVAVAEVFNLVVKTIQNLKDVKKPSVDLAQTVEKHTTLLEKDKARLDSMEEGQRALCTAILALLNHEITGNGVDKLKDAKNALTDYLIRK